MHSRRYRAPTCTCARPPELHSAQTCRACRIRCCRCGSQGRRPRPSSRQCHCQRTVCMSERMAAKRHRWTHTRYMRQATSPGWPDDRCRARMNRQQVEYLRHKCNYRLRLPVNSESVCTCDTHRKAIRSQSKSHPCTLCRESGGCRLQMCNCIARAAYSHCFHSGQHS